MKRTFPPRDPWSARPSPRSTGRSVTPATSKGVASGTRQASMAEKDGSGREARRGKELRRGVSVGRPRHASAPPSTRQSASSPSLDEE